MTICEKILGIIAEAMEFADKGVYDAYTDCRISYNGLGVNFGNKAHLTVMICRKGEIVFRACFDGENFDDADYLTYKQMLENLNYWKEQAKIHA